MNSYFSKVFGQIKDFLSKLSIAKKISIFFIFFIIAIVLVILFFWAQSSQYVPIVTNLNGDDYTNISRILREKHISFKVDPIGKSILIPKERLYDLRLELATMGFPESSVVGYEIFDKQTFGATTFIQKLNQKRALEGELVRTIHRIKGVRRARVHLAMPQKTAFIEDQKTATASVVVDLEVGTVLSEKQVYGIGNLVARAIEGMDPTDVVIMNSEGKILSKNKSDSMSMMAANQLDYQDKVQSDLQKRVEDMLSRIVGEGHVVAKVTADLDFSQINEVETTYDADGSAVVSVEKHVDNMTGSRPGLQGAPGASSNAPGHAVAGGGDIKTETAKNNEVTNYKIPETVRRTIRSLGAIRHLSVAVLIDGKRVKTVGADGKTVTQVEPWSPEKLKEFEQIVTSAAGLNLKRGDTLEIKNIEFKSEDFDEIQKVISDKEYKSYVENLVNYAVIGLTVFLFFVFVVRPFIKWVTENTIDSVDAFLPQTIEELEKLQKNSNLAHLEEAVPSLPESIDPIKAEGEMIKEKIITLIDANPHKAALILKDWLHADAKKRSSDKPNEGKIKGNEKLASA